MAPPAQGKQHMDPEPKPPVPDWLAKYMTSKEGYKLAAALAITRSELSWTMEELETILQAVVRARIFLANIDQVLAGVRTLDYVTTTDEFVFDLANPDISSHMRAAFETIDNEEIEL